MTAAQTIRIPANGWRPRDYQLPAWDYLVGGGLHAEIIAHRRWGKDEIALHWTCVAALRRRANYWHMLPLANQARKAIWTAVNPHTGRRRIDEAFPHAIRRRTRDQEMQIELVNGSTWQVLGSDNFQGSVGSSPAGIVFSEWAQSDPQSRGYLRPILLENRGWQVYITTPRGHNHAKRTFEAAQRDPHALALLSTAHETGRFAPEELERERLAYIADYGEDLGQALFEQEYLCSFEAAIIGAYYGREIARARREGRITRVAHDPEHLVHTAWDFGFRDDTAIWWYQVIGGEVRVIDYYFASGMGPDHYGSQVLGREVELEVTSRGVESKIGDPIPGLEPRREYRYGTHNLPHDAKSRTLFALGKSGEEQLAAIFGWPSLRVLPRLSLEDGIQAARTLFPRVWIDQERCAEGLDGLAAYQREWDEDRQTFKPKPLHNWASHPADAWRYLAIAYQIERPADKPVDRNVRPFAGESWLSAGDQQGRRKVRY